jgi:tetratricopeptide (TPR) repeat protein
MEQSVSESIVRELKLSLTSEEQKLLTKRYTDNAEVHRLYLYGRSEWNKRTRDGAEKAIDLFQQALDRQRNYAPAYSGLADCYITLGSAIYPSPWPPRGVMPKAKYAAERALAIDETLAEAHASLGFILLWYEWDFAGAKREFERAIELEPNYPTAHQWYAHYLTAIGHHEEAIREARRSCDLDPSSASYRSLLGSHLYYARQYNQAIEQAGRARLLNARLRPMYCYAAYIELGRYDEAVDYYIEANALAGERQEKLQELRIAYRTGGIRGCWKELIGQYARTAKHDPELMRYFAIVYAFLGEKDKAFAYLEKAYEERNGFLIFLNVDPRFDNLRSDPRFSDLVRRVDLPQELKQ